MTLILTIVLFSPEHPSPRIVSPEEVVHSVQLRLVKVGVVEEPFPVPGQKPGLLHWGPLWKHFIDRLKDVSFELSFWVQFALKSRSKRKKQCVHSEIWLEVYITLKVELCLNNLSPLWNWNNREKIHTSAKLCQQTGQGPIIDFCQIQYNIVIKSNIWSSLKAA